MKILHLSSERTWRGGEQQIAYLIDGLLEEGHDCFVACKKNSAFEKHCVNNNINHISLSFSNEFDIFTAWQIRNFTKEFDIDIVHAHSGHSHAISVWASILGSTSKLILSRRVDFEIKKNWFSKFKYNYSKIKHVICVSDAIKNVVSKGLKQPEKCITIHSGIDINRFKNASNNNVLRNELGIDNKMKIVANISAIAPHKDYYTFVDAAAEILKLRRDIVFVIIGDGPEKNNIKNYIDKKGLEGYILLTGFRTDIDKIIKELDVFLITSKTEGLGTTILDAFANDIPVVATSGGGISEIVIHNKTGLLAPVSSPKKLAILVNEVIENRELAKEIIAGAKRLLEESFTRQTTSRKTIELYKKSL